ncbi:MAG: ATP-binding protein [Chloroherpetonaceae bacterium]|nr:ATP-binding protein [Chloroherpetonaceae bacterium]
MQDSSLQSLILESAELAYCVVDEADRVAQMSASLGALLDANPSDAIGQSFSSLLLPKLLSEPPDLSADALEVDVALLHRFRALQFRLTKKRLPASRPLWLFLFADLTSQKRVEQDLDQTTKILRIVDDQLQAVLDAVPAYISWVSKDGTYLGANQRLANLLGLKLGDIVGQRVGFRGDEVFEQIVKTFFATDERQISAEYRIAIDDKNLVMLFFGQKYFDNSAAVFVGVDISQRKAMEEQLREQAKLLEVARDAIIVVDENDVVLFWNSGAERLYGWKREDALGNRKADLLYDHIEFKQHFEAQARVFQDGEWEGELNQRARDGRKIVVQSRRTLLDAIGNQTRKVLIVNTDITEKKSLESQLRRNQRVEHIGLLASGIAHDMNNVLTPIMASLEMLKQTLSDEKSLKRISMLENSAHRGKALMEQILLFARGQEGEMNAMDLRLVVKDIANLIEQTFPKNVALEARFEPNLPFVLGDNTQLHQVLLNLVVNARDAMPNGGKITISLAPVSISAEQARGNIDARAGDYVLLVVSDTGTGIPQEHLDKIFDPFFTTKPEGKGTGLGLSTVLSIIRAHKGFLTVESVLNKGTTFKIYLPVATVDATSAPAAMGDAASDKGAGETILVVDDDEAVGEVAAELLQNAGYKTFLAKNGEEAFTIYAEHRADIRLVLTDMVMPKMDGANLIRALRAIQPSLAIVAMSGLMDKEKLMKMAGVGQDSFITKPFTGETLLRVVRQRLRPEKANA